LASLDDLDPTIVVAPTSLRDHRSFVGAVSEDHLQPGERAGTALQQLCGPRFVLHISRLYGDRQDKTQGIDQNMPLASGYPFARIVATKPPFSVVFTL
jgi:hypothetical protein